MQNFIDVYGEIYFYDKYVPEEIGNISFLFHKLCLIQIIVHAFEEVFVSSSVLVKDRETANEVVSEEEVRLLDAVYTVHKRIENMRQVMEAAENTTSGRGFKETLRMSLSTFRKAV